MTQFAFSSLIDVKVGGAALPPTKMADGVADKLVAAWVDLGAGVPGAFQLTFRDKARREVLDLANIKIGTKIVLAPVADGKGAQDPLLTGEVTGLEADYDGAGTFTVVRGYDFGHRLLRQRRVVGYTKMTAAAIVRKLVEQSSIKVGRIEPTRPAYDFITQDNITDWDFIARLADENEKVMYLDSDGKFQFVSRERASGAPPEGTDGEKSQLVLQGGRDVLRCRAAVTSTDQVPQVEVRGWDVGAKRALTSKVDALTNPAIDIGARPGEMAKKFKATRLVETSTPYDQQPQVKRAAESLADDVTSSFAELEVTVRGNPKIRPDVPVLLEDVGEPFEGKYTVTGVRHSFENGRPYRTQVTVSGRQWRSLYGLASGGAKTATRMPSVANGVVTDVKDPQRLGRVKLKFPWLNPTYVSDWTRTVQLGGVSGGSIIPLDVNDEVLVAFDRGALDHPFVIGGLYNGKDRPRPGDVPLHDKLSGKASRHTLADREFNRIDLLSQQTGLRKRGVRLSTGNNRLVINLDRTKTEITVDSKGSVSIKGSRSVSVEAGADLSLKAGGSLSLDAGGSLSVGAGGAMSLRAGAAMSIDAGMAMAINSTAMVIDAKAALNITAALAASIEGATVTVTGAAVSLLGPAITANRMPVV
ncbi:VgrG-related protein [Streptomyces sp. A 4/2]|uniref:VgrG-related protein n=1 Tax=Streptomyces sp. A 4/2 TaxID=2934314 RepID=UPI002024FCE8|nr:VgrG-related protein [Streptomyces sp. A 4/2]